MEFDTPLDYVAFQLSPKLSRCELFASANGNTEKLASGLVKPFMTHLKVVEEQVALSLQSIKLEVGKCKNAESWFTKGTLERFVRFVSTPEVVELVITFDAEMSQLEAARRIYSQGSSDQLSSNLGDGRSSTAARADVTKKELLRAIDVRLTAVKQDLSTACARADAAGFNHAMVADLQLFAERFGATRLNEACCKYISLYDRRPELFNNSSRFCSGDQAIRCSYSSDMSIDDDPPTITTEQSSSATAEQSAKPKSSSFTSLPLRPSSTPATRELTKGKDQIVSEIQTAKKEEVGSGEELMAQTATQPSSRRLSVQDRINMFENKQKEVGSGSGGKPAIMKPDLRRLSSDVSHSNSNSAASPAILRRWSGASDMSIDLSGDKDTDSSLKLPVNETLTCVKTEVQKNQTDRLSGSCCRDEDIPTTKVEKTSSGIQLTVSSSSSSSVRPEESNQLTSTLEMMQSWSSLTKPEDDSLEARLKPHIQIKSFHGGKKERFGVSNEEEFRSSIVATSQHETDEGIALRAPSKNSNYQRGGSGSKFQEAVAASQHRGIEIGLLCSQPKYNYSAEVDRNDYAPTEKRYGVQNLKVPRDESIYVDGYMNTPGSGSMPMEPLVEQANRSRQLKGNQELNDELKMKANELEKLFAEHKLRVPGDQPNYSRRSKPFDDGADQATSLPYRKHSVFKSPITVTEVDGQNRRDSLQRSFSEVGLSDDSRGKFYESYMKRREERLKEQWGSNKAEKEARMKAMHDSLERNGAEMKAKLSLSADSQDSVSRRAERLRSFSARSAMKRDQPLDFGQLEDDEDICESSELKLMSNGVSGNGQGKKPLLPMKNSCTSTPRTPAPRSGGTKVASSCGRRKVQSDNPPLVQSVLDLRKENTKPYSVASKAASRSQLRNHTRSRSSSEVMASVNEEKPGRLRKNSPTPPEGVILSFKTEMEPKPFVTSGIAKIMKVPEEEYVVEDGMKIQDEAVVVVDAMESRMMMNSRFGIHHSFSYTQDQDQDQDQDQEEMGKKWASTQKHILVGKDMTKGFKRLLNFGRKSNNVADWISSEGDDDTESRTPFEGSSSDDFCNDEVQSSIPANLRMREDSLSIKAPRSFFSLSSFRSKGSESKLR